jgi:hypothetical protein
MAVTLNSEVLMNSHALHKINVLKTLIMRKKYSKKTEARLLVESKNTCNICWENKDVQIHHINENSSDSSEDNLIVVCLKCHSGIHTNRKLAKNYSPETLRLYKTTWIDLVKRYPFDREYINEKNDIAKIHLILEQSDRRALYFPFHLEIPYNFIKSIKDFREKIQKSGYRLLLNEEAKDSIQNIYKTLVEIEFLFPTDERNFDNCFPGMMGTEKLHLLELKRQEIIYYLNKLGKLVGYPNDLFKKGEFKKIGFDIKKDNEKGLTCFGNIDKGCPKCKICELSKDCIIETMKN